MKVHEFLQCHRNVAKLGIFNIFRTVQIPVKDRRVNQQASPHHVCLKNHISWVQCCNSKLSFFQNYQNFKLVRVRIRGVQIQQLMVKRIQLVNFKKFSKGRFRFGSLYSSSTLRFTPSTSFLMHQHRLMTESRNLSFFTQRDCHPQPHLGYMSDYSTYVRKVGRLASKYICPRNSLPKYHKSV